MVTGSRGPRTPSQFHLMFSTGMGALVPLCVQSHKMVALVLFNLLWVGLHLFMRFRAKRARGVFIDEEVELFLMWGIGGFVLGLFAASAILAVFGPPPWNGK